ncbi:MAG: restriction endonuclease [Candidatus Omnitrophica bacterium]|nr:restriction endonuclease [Candidatus Omnitrophota bacterium]MCA9418502.1 restriction endonuclease [Candidatus Omnitrophota bacterium]MCA9423448.1 restriction endonuclease [Candidatus Omnitrophota bacterium]MCA9440717.1 restriction endonuclease [Candidatus Omnitrophota bacterium]MCB9782545.1 restriction endonuclease [Candidatus Omnitrophota bacterium]
MAIPDFQSIMLPLLKFTGDRKEHSIRGAIDSLADQFNLTKEERQVLLPSGQQATFDNRVHWARSYLKQAHLVENTRRSYFRITDRGERILQTGVDRIDIKFLEQFEEFQEFRNRKKKPTETDTRPEIVSEDQTPEESLENAYQTLREDLIKEVLAQLKTSSPSMFEKIVVDLLLAMGYGGSRKDAGQAIGRSGDEGIDGIIKEDRLGLDIIYIQAKKWDGTVGRPEIQKFAGALQGKRARKGVFIATSNFSKEAVEFANQIENKIILIDGEQVAQYMIDHNLGVTPVTRYEIKRLDSDYFGE